MTENVDRKKDVSNKRIFLALSGSMVALGSATIGYLMFGLVGGFGFVMTLFGFMWYLQTQLESSIEQIEIKVRNE
jgi:hypothetical protein